eukprot:scaffold16956_cov63-Phaeocystis_antarctica.AAC.2
MRLDLPAFDSPATQMWGSELSSSRPCSSTATLGQLRTWTSLRLLRTRNSLESGGGGLWAVATALMSRGRRRAARAGRSSAERSGIETASETANSRDENAMDRSLTDEESWIVNSGPTQEKLAASPSYRYNCTVQL